MLLRFDSTFETYGPPYFNLVSYFILHSMKISAKELGTISRNNLRGTTLRIWPIKEDHPLLLKADSDSDLFNNADA